MKKSVISLIFGIILLALAFVLFVLGMSSPTVTGPAFMYTVWLIIIAAGIFLIGLGVVLTVMKK